MSANTMYFYFQKKYERKNLEVPGLEPGSFGWQPTVLTIRLQKVSHQDECPKFQKFSSC